MTTDDIPDWAKDENDPPATMWEKKEKKDDPVEEESEGETVEESNIVIEDEDEDTNDEEEESEDTDDEEEESEDTDDEEEESEDTDDEEEESEDTDDEEEESEDEIEDEDEDEPLDDEEDESEPPKDNAKLDDLTDEEPREDKDKEITTPLNPEKGTNSQTEDENAVKSHPTSSFIYSIFHPAKKIKYWFDGDEEHPLPVYSWRAKFKRWRLIHFHNHVWLRIMSYDKTRNEYTICEDLIPRKMLPKTAVHCTNEKNVYFDKLFDVPYEPWKDNGFGAMNAYLYMKDTSIDEALLLLWQGPKMNMRTMAIIGIIAVAAVFYIFYMMQG